MGLRQRLVITRLAALAALAASAALLTAHLRPGSPLCGFASGCGEVLGSGFGEVLGVPLPAVGVVAFAALFGLSLWPGARRGRLLRWLALAAGAAGLALILLQVLVIRRVCPYCLVVDGCALVAAWACAGRPEEGTPPRPGPLWLAAAVAALGGGAALGTAGGRPAPGAGPVPPQIVAQWVPGKVTIVEVADFQCPHCRRAHAVLRRFLEGDDGRIHFVRLTAPMPAHPQARDASRAYLCAQVQGRGEEAAERLFAADDLSAAACERLAVEAGARTGPFRACVADPATDRRLDAELAWVRAACPDGLPAVWVQDRLLTGVPSAADLANAVLDAERAARAGDPE